MHDEHPVLAIDHGDARIGIAASDAAGIMAHPVETIQVREVDAIQRIAELVAAREVPTVALSQIAKMAGLTQARWPSLALAPKS